MNLKLLSQPKTMAELMTYWAWKKIDLNRTIDSMVRFRSQTPYEHIKADLTFKILDKIDNLKTIESLIKQFTDEDLDD